MAQGQGWSLIARRCGREVCAGPFTVGTRWGDVCASLTCHQRASTMEEALSNQIGKMAVHMLLSPVCMLDLCSNRAMAAELESLHELKNMSFPLLRLIPDMVSFPRAT